LTSNPNTAGVIAPPPLLALAAVVFGLLLDGLFPAYVLTVLLDFSDRIIVALVLFAASAALAIPAMLAFRRAGTHIEPWKPATKLVTGGIFRFVRNPMYVGLILLVAATGVALASDWTLVMTVALAVTLHVGVVRREERYLAAKYGERYRDYCRRVSRYGWPG
jgi:protein-S-isoprenylcysteine O-methyltransferase Ste14